MRVTVVAEQVRCSFPISSIDRYIHIYIYTCICMHIYIYIYIYIYIALDARIGGERLCYARNYARHRRGGTGPISIDRYIRIYI